jgi:hypothetical protein
MINLIPPQGRTALKHEYILRVGSLYAFLLAGVCVAGTALFIPTYVLTSSQLTGAKDKSAEIEVTKQAFDRAFEEIKVANTLMAQLQKTKTTTPATKVIEEIIRLAPEGLRFTAFGTSEEAGVLKNVTVSGNASTRQALVSFKAQIEASPLFDEVVIPLSDLARETELPFSVSIQLEVETGAITDTP